MPHFHSYISSAVKIIESYKGSQPLGQFLKYFFSANKKYGSKDRKTIAALCYYYFRTGHASKTHSIEEKILNGLLLCSDKHSDLLESVHPEWNKKIVYSKKEKLDYLSIQPFDIFPFVNELSAEIDAESYCLSFLSQPELFIRIRPGKKEGVIKKLEEALIPYKLLNDDCIALANAEKIDCILKINSEVVIQDHSSQRVFDFLKAKLSYFKNKEIIAVWDCCAASGGKSILFQDRLNEKMHLTVSDIRPAILENLKKRLKDASIKIDKSFVADITKENLSHLYNSFDIIICDAPCTGSGSWGRTPEQLYYFDNNKINYYSDLQRKIAASALPCLKNRGLFFYITCSVFKKENEDVVSFIKENFQLKLLHQEYLKGYEVLADTMFVAVFEK